MPSMGNGFILFDDKDAELISSWTWFGGVAGAWDSENADELSEDLIVKRLCFHEFGWDVAMAQETNEDISRYCQLKPYLMRAYVRGYRHHAKAQGSTDI